MHNLLRLFLFLMPTLLHSITFIFSLSHPLPSSLSPFSFFFYSLIPIIVLLLLLHYLRLIRFLLTPTLLHSITFYLAPASPLSSSNRSFIIRFSSFPTILLYYCCIIFVSFAPPLRYLLRVSFIFFIFSKIPPV